MRSTGARIAVALAALAAVVVLFVVFAGGDDEGDSGTTATTTQPSATATTNTTTTTKTTTVEAAPQVVVRNGKPAGGVRRLEFESGEQVRFVVTSDVSDEVHVHGYDIAKDVKAGSSVRFSFPASIEGVFEVELEDRGEQIAELRVSP